MAATALQLRKNGVSFVRDANGNLTSVRGPESSVAQARSEVERRVSLMASPKTVATKRVGQCETCGDELEAWRGGWCELCTLARRVALRGAT